MRRYILELARNLGLIVGGLTAGIMLLFMVIDVCMGGSGEVLRVLTMGSGVGLLLYGALMIPAIFFGRMIRRQEQMGLRLDTEVQRVERTIVGTYLGENWLIYAGIVALHHSRIKHVEAQHTGRGTAASMTYICVETVNGWRYRWAMESAAIGRIRAWLESHKTEQSA